jgi:dTDP-4-amino-4,6-dideoxygalactose transaminase
VQLRKLPENNGLRRHLTQLYRRGLAAACFSGIEAPFGDAQGESAHHLLPILLPQGVERETFMDCMRQSRVQTSIHYPPVHCFSYYRERYPGVSLPVTERLAAREVTLPLYPMMTAEDVEYVLAAAAQALARARTR